MSNIPKRKKSPEEIAALREKDLSALMAVAPPNTPPPLAVQKSFPSTPIAPLPPSPPKEPSPPREPRRAHPLRHGTPHLFEGLRPQEASDVISPEVAVQAHTPLPNHKHSDQEIMQMRRRDLMQTRPPVASIRNMGLHFILVVPLYLLTIAIPWLTIRFWNLPSPKNWIAPALGCGILIALGSLIYLRKKRARHHAAFVCGVAIITLSFCILNTLK